MKTFKSKSPSFRSPRGAWLLAGVALPLASFTASAQIDPAPRQLLHLGANASLSDQGPMGAYAFYYWNMPNVPTTNEVLRLVIAPVYVDADLGFQHLLGQNTDLAVGAFGGKYANSYQEVDHGQWYKDQSFDGNSGGFNVSLYQRFNPDQHIPLTGVLRATMDYNAFETTDNTGKAFVLPESQPIMTYRAGFRWGGKEPMLTPILGMEISAWYELDQRTSPGGYGYGNDRELERASQRFFARAQINYTTLESKHYVVAGIQGGTMINADRISAFRLGGMLPYTKEFPLPIPGYFFQELSAKSYGLAYGTYAIPFGDQDQWSVLASGSAALVDYVEGTGQPGAFNSGIGAGGGYTAPSKRWKILSEVGYGFEAEREHGRGGYTLGVAFQYNFGDTKTAADEGYAALEEMHTATK